MAGPKRYRPKLPNGEDVILTAGKDDALKFQILDDDGEPRDNATDTYSVAAKLDTTAKTLIVSKTTPSADGQGVVTFPSAQIASGGELYVDIMVAKSGGDPNVSIRWQITVEDSDAD